MKKIIPIEEAKNYLCPTAVPTNPPARNGNRCQGPLCMKWEDEMKEVETKVVQNHQGGLRTIGKGTKLEPTHCGYCGL